jgi:predicted dehydrogenase
MTNAKKNICIVGCGNIGRFHARNLAKFSNLYFHSHSKDSAEKFNQNFNGKGIFHSFDAVMKSPEIDALVISSPPDFHKEQIVRSLQAGKSVLVEKPMCISEAEIAEIGKVLEQMNGNAFLMIAENYYYKPSLKLIKHLLYEGCIGEIQTVDVKKTFVQQVVGWRTQYGALLEGGIHFVAIISAIFDDAPTKIDACFPGMEAGEIERHSVTEMQYRNKAFARLTYSWKTRSLSKGVFQTSSIIGDKGKIVFESNGIYVLLKSDQKTCLYLPHLPDVLGYKAMTADFLGCLDGKRGAPYSDFDKAKRDLGIVFRAYGGKRWSSNVYDQYLQGRRSDLR